MLFQYEYRTERGRFCFRGKQSARFVIVRFDQSKGMVGDNAFVFQWVISALTGLVNKIHLLYF